MPGIEENDDDTLIIFWTGERDSLNNAKVGAPLNVPRDIGFTILEHDFSKQFSDADLLLNIKTDKYNEEVDIVDADGYYYDSDGTNITMANNGNAWLTDYREELTDNGEF